MSRSNCPPAPGDGTALVSATLWKAPSRNCGQRRTRSALLPSTRPPTAAGMSRTAQAAVPTAPKVSAGRSSLRHSGLRRCFVFDFFRIPRLTSGSGDRGRKSTWHGSGLPRRNGSRRSRDP
jgi:hypothetical protein